MANPVLKQYGPQGDLFRDSTERKALKREKFGVIGGFLIGVLVASGVVDPLLLSASIAPAWAHIGSAVLVAACTWAGYGLGTAGRRQND